MQSGAFLDASARDAFATGQAEADASGETAPTASSVSDAFRNEVSDLSAAIGDAAASMNVPVGACCGQPEPNCAAGVCCVASDCPPSERCLHHACQSVTCGPIEASTYYVDPLAGIDQAPSTGSANCPFRSLTHALSVIGPDAGVGATIEIVNDAVAPILSESTGEDLPITPPANVTITAQDPTQNAPILEVHANQILRDDTGQGGGYVYVFALENPSCKISHLVVDGNKLDRVVAFEIHSAPGSVDHVTVRNAYRGFEVENFGVLPDGGGLDPFSIGPGVIVQDSSEDGVFLYGHGALTIHGGRGSDHTSFSQNAGTGIALRDLASLTIDGTDIDPATPDENDVDTDGNKVAGLAIGQYGEDLEPGNVVRGLHSSGNWHGIEAEPCARLKLRGSYAANNTGAGVYIATALPSGGECNDGDPPAPGDLDLGNSNGPDYGRNIFQSRDAGPASNVSGSICVADVKVPAFHPPWPTILAAGNIFGGADCALGGTLKRLPTCSDQADVGGVSPDAGAIIALDNCE